MMHLMVFPGKSPPPDRRIRRTEAAVIAAAKELFEQQGYAATTMSEIADRADCAPRTLFVRFGTKAELLMRVVDHTFAGDASEPVKVAAASDRRTQMMTAATLEERLRAFADGAADALVRTGPMFAVAREAEASEPDIAAAFDAARHATVANSHRLWRRLADDGFLHPDVDVTWVADTTALLASADTYLLMRTTLAWTPSELADWLHRTWTHFATTPSDH